MSAAPGLVRLNRLAEDEAAAALAACCGSTAWARGVAACRPFDDPEELFAAAERIWWELSPDDWREAFVAHPRIGERSLSPGAGWSEAEQAGAYEASSSLLAELAAANRAYEVRFDHIFLICATGKSAGEMLAALQARMANDPAAELRIAAFEQAKITHLRLARLLT